MALQHTFEMAEGISLPAAYARISSIAHNHAETVVSVQVWASAAARQADLPTIWSQSFSLPWTDGVSLTSAYVALKQVPMFSAALDV